MLRASCFVLGAILCAELAAQTATPRSVADELLAADRAFSTAAAKVNVVDGLSAMFTADVIMPTPAGVFADGKAKAIEALKTNPDNVTGRVQWSPAGVGISADGQQGFTYGYMTLTKADKSTVAVKYLAYWIKTPDGWRVLGYKRRGSPPNYMSMDPTLHAPDRFIPAVTDAAVIERHRASLAAAEKSFSDEAQKIGIGPAFEKNGSPDAVNMGGSQDAEFVRGNVNIGKAVGVGAPAGSSPVNWAADYKTIVASSGDLGITFGHIKPNAPGPDARTPAGSPFFTIWRRANASAPWRYVAE